MQDVVCRCPKITAQLSWMAFVYREVLHILQRFGVRYKKGKNTCSFRFFISVWLTCKQNKHRKSRQPGDFHGVQMRSFADDEGRFWLDENWVSHLVELYSTEPLDESLLGWFALLSQAFTSKFIVGEIPLEREKPELSHFPLKPKKTLTSLTGGKATSSYYWKTFQKWELWHAQSI